MPFRIAISAAQLRKDAEARLAQSHASETSVSGDADLLHQLRVQQIELEMQNETLRQSQVALEESRDRYVDFYDFAPVGYVTLGETDLIDEINLSGAEMLGVDRSRLLRHRFSPYVVAEDRDRWQQHFGRALREGSKINCEVALLRPDGSRIDVWLDSLLLMRQGKAPVLRVVLTDVTARKRVDDALKISQRRFRDIVNTTDGIVWEADARTFDFTFVSQQAERLLGYPVVDWLQPGFWVKNLHPDDQAWAPDYCASCTGKLQPHDFEYRFIARDGRAVWLHDIVTVVVEEGAPRWLRGIMVDITHRKQAEERLREMAAGLETQVMERTKELRVLSAQLAMTEERERRLLAQDLHDNLGQLLAVIRIKLSSLVDALPRSSFKQIAGLVDQAEQTARMITVQLSPPILHTLGFVPALEWLAEDMESTYDLVVHVDGESAPKPLVDEIQAMLYRSVRELLINVARHAQVSEASVCCRCKDGRLMLIVSDNGCGFDLMDSRGALHTHGGFGLNSIRERIVNIGGEMDIDSSPGNGATITLTVPCSIAEKENPDDPDHACR